MTDAYSNEVKGCVDENGEYSPGNKTRYAAFVGIDGCLRVVEHTRVDISREVAGPDGQTLFHPPKGVYSTYVGPSIATPIFVGNKLIVAGYHGIRLFEFDGEGDFRQMDSLGQAFEFTPIVHNGRIYVASRNGYMYCLGRKKFLF